MIRVVLADDEQLLREGFAVILGLEEDIEVVGQAADGVEALELVRAHEPDVLVMDIQMPRMDGLAVAERLGSRSDRRTRILLLTSFDLDDYLYRALRAGAGGFLLKDVPRHQLISAVRTIAAGDELLSPAITRRLVEEFVRRRTVPHSSAEALSTLTGREREILTLVARGMSNGEIAGHVLLGEATVKTHLGNVFSKCGLRDRAQAVVFAYESGLVSPAG